MLEELIVSENKLQDMPHSIATMAMLRVLKLQNNDLRSIPFELVDVVTLEELDFSGNPGLKTVPKLWQGDTDSVLFVCKIHRGRLSNSLWLPQMCPTHLTLTRLDRLPVPNVGNHFLKHRPYQALAVSGTRTVAHEGTAALSFCPLNACCNCRHASHILGANCSFEKWNRKYEKGHASIYA